ncbi:hypothetical protein ZIOFF_070141 [Zingiber officinale]|uniref:MLO-like protein n=1 Tax=Zingiber officinale TaxID=94328 RepID=A0A8J5BIC9_ZINOF|nr:hypothetical protein ZIOFF_070141 [Zingiber officinale]
MSTIVPETRSLALTPTWSVAAVLTIFVAVSLLVERSIHRLSKWLKKTRRNPLFEALEKMKEELMLLGFISLLLTATSRSISKICINSKFYSGKFSPCTRAEVDDTVKTENGPAKEHKLLGIFHHLSIKSTLSEHNPKTCSEACLLIRLGHEPFVSYEGLEQLHRFIFVMAITHVLYSCLTMLLAIVKIHTWRNWEEEARRDQYDSYGAEITRALTMRRQSSFMKIHSSNSWSRNSFVIWVFMDDRLVSFVNLESRSYGLTTLPFVGVLSWNFYFFPHWLTVSLMYVWQNHNLTPRYDFHSYMIRSMEEEFKRIVGVRSDE